MSCTVKNCKNIKRLLPAGCNISFHRFPHNKELFQEWLDALSLDKNTQWTKFRLVCSDHFDIDDFVPDVEVRRLKPNVVPSLKPHIIESVFVDINSSFFDEELEQNPSANCDNSVIGKMVMEEQNPLVKSEYIEPIFVDVSRSFSEEHLELPPSTNCDVGMIERGDDNRLVPNIQDSPYSNSTSELIRCVQLDHQYFTSPKSLKQRMERIRHKHVTQKKQLYRSQEKVKRLEKKVNALKRVIKHLQSKCALSNGDINILEKTLIDPEYKTKKQ